MSDDFTQKLSQTDRDAILTPIKNLDANVRGWIDKLTIWISSIDSRLQSLDTNVQILDVKVQALDTKVQALNTKVEERLHDTRPIWHKVVADIGQLQVGQDAIRSQLTDLDAKVREVNRDQLVINDSIRKIQSDFHTIDHRLCRLEIQRPH